MEWRQQTSVSCADAFNEAQRWIEEVTGKLFGCNNFRAALETGVLLCDLINQLKPGIIKRVNRLSTPIAGLDNVNVFLKACGKLGLNESQLFHPGDLQDLSSRANLRRDESKRRLKNVLITIYWLGRKAHLDPFYAGPQLSFKAFEGLLGLALSKSLDEGSIVFGRNGGDKECWYPDKHRDTKMDSPPDGFHSSNPRALRQNSEGCGSDAEAEQVFRMETGAQQTQQQSRGYVPAPLRRRQGQGSNNPLASTEATPLSHTECAVDEEGLFLPALLDEDSEDEYTDADPVQDDLYSRRVRLTLHQTSTNPAHDRFLPRHWTPEEESRVRTIHLGSRKRPWYRELLRLRVYQVHVRPQAPVQVNPGWIWSKSLSDIPMVYPARKAPDEQAMFVGQEAGMGPGWSQEYKRKCSVAATDSEAQWHDDLNKWKNRRRSSKSELRTRSQDREHFSSQITTAAAPSGFDQKGAHGGPLKRHSSAPRPYTTSPPSKPSSSDLRPRTRALLARSYATEVPPFSPTAHHATQEPPAIFMPASAGNIFGEDARCASLASDGAGITTPSVDFPYSSKTPVQAPALIQPSSTQPTQPPQPENIIRNHVSTLVTTIQPNQLAKPTTRIPIVPMSDHKEPDPKVSTFCPDDGAPAVDKNQTGVGEEESQKSGLDQDVGRGRGQQPPRVNNKYLYRAGSWSGGSASLPRGYRRSDGSSRLSSALTARPFGAKPSRMSSLPRPCSVDLTHPGLLFKSEKDPSPSPPPFDSFSLKRQTATVHLKSPPCPQDPAAGQQKPNDGTERAKPVKSSAALPSRISFQTTTSYGAQQRPPYSQGQPQQTLPQPYSNPQHSHSSGKSSLHALSSSGSTDRPKVDHSDMRVSLTLKPDSRADFGFQTHWDSTGATVQSIQPGSPAEHCRLCVGDEVVAVGGVPVGHMTYVQWKDKMAAALHTGSLTMDIRRYGNKDWSSSDGNPPNPQSQSRLTLNLTAAQPTLIGYSTDTTTGTNVAKLNGKTDDVMQGKVAHGDLVDGRTATNKDYESVARETKRRREEFFKKKGGTESAISDLQVPPLSPGPWQWDQEQDRRRQEKWQEEQERLLQEQYQRDQERLEAEWRRAQQDAAGDLIRKPRQTTLEMTNGGLNPGAHPHSHAQGPHTAKIAEQAWPGGSCGFATLSPQHRGKSLSTPTLAGPQKQKSADHRRTIGHSAVSQGEQERQRILEELKKRTQLLKDSSWIRQRSSSFYREPVYVGVPIKRFESLDNLLDTMRDSPTPGPTFTYPRPHSAAAGYCPPSRNAASRYSTGSMLSQRHPAAMESYQHGGMVNGGRSCCVCERALGGGAAMVIEALSLCFHLACFQCVGCHRILGGSESGAQVRIRNGKPHCEPCYFQHKSSDAPAM